MLARLTLSAAFMIAMPLLAFGQATDADQALVDQGRYLVIAGDCAACHGADFSGGEPIPSPIGAIYASNITPDPETGVGDWTLRQFSAALREGKGAEGHLYPAMPYTSYTGLSDEDVRAMWSYLTLSVDPVRNEPPQTDLPFPFVRPAMTIWNALFLDKGVATGAQSVEGETLERGRYLVETLGHCSDCHTPRGRMMQQLSDKHLSGALTGGWWAPNITPHETGVGDWSDDELATYLETGHTADAVAGGEMATVISRSLSKLSEADIAAIVAYLRAAPAIASEQPQRIKAAETPPVQLAALSDAGDWRLMISHDTTEGDVLYQSACASCHGIGGRGSAHLAHPSLHRVNSVAAPEPVSLVQVIAHGLDRKVGADHAFMPGFGASMNDAQIAALANYVRTDFGGVASDLDEEQVSRILQGETATPWMIENARWLAIIAIVAAVVVILAIGWLILRLTLRRTHAST